MSGQVQRDVFSSNARATDRLVAARCTTQSLRIPTDAADGKIFVSGPTGQGSWKDAPQPIQRTLVSTVAKPAGEGVWSAYTTTYEVIMRQLAPSTYALDLPPMVVADESDLIDFFIVVISADSEITSFAPTGEYTIASGMIVTAGGIPMQFAKCFLRANPGITISSVVYNPAEFPMIVYVYPNPIPFELTGDGWPTPNSIVYTIPPP